MKSKLFDYVERDNFIFRLSGVTKLICFGLLMASVMFTHDIRSIIGIMIFSFCCLFFSGIKFSQVKVMFAYLVGLLGLSFILTYLFAPTYGVEQYGTYHEIFRFTDHYVVTLEQLLYQSTRVMKSISMIPMGMLFLLTTNPSEFASSLNKLGVGYKGTFAVSLTLRYFPDMIRNYTDISLAQQSRGIDMSSKEKFSVRVKNMLNICVPLIFSVLERVDIVGNAMDLRGFGTKKKRTWYTQKKLRTGDYISILFCGGIFIAVMYISICINGGRFYNPFI